MFNRVSFCIDSVRSVVGIEVLPGLYGIVEGGRRARDRENAAEGKTVSALTRMLVTVSGCSSCGLNWYLATQISLCLEIDGA